MATIETKYLELWADSFHEGDWAIQHVARILEASGVKVDVRYINGFIPQYRFSSADMNLCITVLGSYRSWSPLPPAISELLAWGSPDLILYIPADEHILFSIEETAAVPTGNQALQRCERMYGALRASVPFWYLITEFGKHLDGGIRCDSIWPTIMALKLTRAKNTPCVVLHYSDENNPEDYDSGKGLESLFDCLVDMIANYAKGSIALDDMEDPLSGQFKEMLSFVKRQWQEIVEFLPGSEVLEAPTLPRLYARTAMNNRQEMSQWPENFLIWPKTSTLPPKVRSAQKGRGLIKHDGLCAIFEEDISNGKSYGLSKNTGSRPQPRDSIEKWITQQKTMFAGGIALEPPAEYSVKLSDFPESKSGLYHVTTAKNIVYLYDRWEHVLDAIESAYPRLKGKIDKMDISKPTLVYISNSLKPGRIFGDPYTGQISAFATVFGRFDPEPRYVVAYFPHQSYTQAIIGSADKTNKGLVLMRELTDLLVFGGGVAVRLDDAKVF